MSGRKLTRLGEIAHSRAGDKGNDSNLSLIAWRPEDYPRLVAQVTPERVRAHFAGLGLTSVERYELPELHCLNFVLRNALAGGVTTSLRIDPHGKALSSALLEMSIEEWPLNN